MTVAMPGTEASANGKADGGFWVRSGSGGLGLKSTNKPPRRAARPKMPAKRFMFSSSVPDFRLSSRTVAAAPVPGLPSLPIWTCHLVPALCSEVG